MRVAGVLHIFQFETRQGEDICTALQTHINDIMMKRYSKAKQSTNGDRALPQANFGPKYEQHVNTIQKALEETKQKLVDQEAIVSSLTYERVRSLHARAEAAFVRRALDSWRAGRPFLFASAALLEQRRDKGRR